MSRLPLNEKQMQSGASITYILKLCLAMICVNVKDIVYNNYVRHFDRTAAFVGSKKTAK